MDDMPKYILMRRIITWNIQRVVPRTGYPHPRSLSPGTASPIIWKFSMPGPSKKKQLISINGYNVYSIYYSEKQKLPSETEEAVSSWSGRGWDNLPLINALSLDLSPILSIEPCWKEGNTPLQKLLHTFIDRYIHTKQNMPNQHYYVTCLITTLTDL